MANVSQWLGRILLIICPPGALCSVVFISKINMYFFIYLCISYRIFYIHIIYMYINHQSYVNSSIYVSVKLFAIQIRNIMLKCSVSMFLNESFLGLLSVVSGGSDCCASTRQARLRGTSGHIASIETEESGCGSIDCPWLIEMSPGQKVNISLYEFALPSLEEIKEVRQRMPAFSKVRNGFTSAK